MDSMLKKLMIWLLIAVLPIQGFAARAHHSCDSEHMAVSGASRALVVEKALVFEKNKGQELMSANDAHDGCAEHSSHSVKKPAKSSPCKRGSCSACASCCVGAAAPPVVVSFALPSNVPEVRHASGATLVIGYIPDSLERPPRYFTV